MTHIAKVFFTLTLSAVVVAAAWQPAAAQCDFNHGKWKGWSGSLVRSHHTCPDCPSPSGCYQQVNSQTPGGTPSCAPPMLRANGIQVTSYRFGPKGGCHARVSPRSLEDCSMVRDADGNSAGYPAEPCYLGSIKARCSGVRQVDEETPINAFDDSGWTLSLLLQATFDDPLNGDMTPIRFPVTLMFDEPARGTIRLRSSIAEGLAAYGLGPANSVLPACTNLQIIDLVVLDPDGGPFVEEGVSGSAGAESPVDIGLSKGLKVSLVRAYEPCGYFDFNTTSAVAQLPACMPARLLESEGVVTSYRFDENGGCTFELSEDVEEDCSVVAAADGSPLNLPQRACFLSSMRARCSGIVTDVGAPIDATLDSGWSLTVTSGFTIDEPLHGPMTLVNLSQTFPFPPPRKGTLRLTGNSAEGLVAAMGDEAALPPATIQKVVSVVVHDPEGRPFAVLGTYEGS